MSTGSKNIQSNIEKRREKLNEARNELRQKNADFNKFKQGTLPSFIEKIGKITSQKERDQLAKKFLALELALVKNEEERVAKIKELQVQLLELYQKPKKPGSPELSTLYQMLDQKLKDYLSIQSQEEVQETNNQLLREARNQKPIETFEILVTNNTFIPQDQNASSLKAVFREIQDLEGPKKAFLDDFLRSEISKPNAALISEAELLHKQQQSELHALHQKRDQSYDAKVWEKLNIADKKWVENKRKLPELEDAERKLQDDIREAEQKEKEAERKVRENATEKQNLLEKQQSLKAEIANLDKDIEAGELARVGKSRQKIIDETSQNINAVNVDANNKMEVLKAKAVQQAEVRKVERTSKMEEVLQKKETVEMDYKKNLEYDSNLDKIKKDITKKLATAKKEKSRLFTILAKHKAEDEKIANAVFATFVPLLLKGGDVVKALDALGLTGFDGKAKIEIIRHAFAKVKKTNPEMYKKIMEYLSQHIADSKMKPFSDSEQSLAALLKSIKDSGWKTVNIEKDVIAIWETRNKKNQLEKTILTLTREKDAIPQRKALAVLISVQETQLDSLNLEIADIKNSEVQDEAFRSSELSEKLREIENKKAEQIRQLERTKDRELFKIDDTLNSEASLTDPEKVLLAKKTSKSTELSNTETDLEKLHARSSVDDKELAMAQVEVKQLKEKHSLLKADIKTVKEEIAVFESTEHDQYHSEIGRLQEIESEIREARSKLYNTEKQLKQLQDVNKVPDEQLLEIYRNVAKKAEIVGEQQSYFKELQDYLATAIKNRTVEILKKPEAVQLVLNKIKPTQSDITEKDIQKMLTNPEVVQEIAQLLNADLQAFLATNQNAKLSLISTLQAAADLSSDQQRNNIKAVPPLMVEQISENQEQDVIEIIDRVKDSIEAQQPKSNHHKIAAESLDNVSQQVQKLEITRQEATSRAERERLMQERGRREQEEKRIAEQRAFDEKQRQREETERLERQAQEAKRIEQTLQAARAEYMARQEQRLQEEQERKVQMEKFVLHAVNLDEEKFKIAMDAYFESQGVDGFDYEDIKESLENLDKYAKAIPNDELDDSQYLKFKDKLDRVAINAYVKIINVYDVPVLTDHFQQILSDFNGNSYENAARIIKNVSEIMIEKIAKEKNSESIQGNIIIAGSNVLSKVVEEDIQTLMQVNNPTFAKQVEQSIGELQNEYEENEPKPDLDSFLDEKDNENIKFNDSDSHVQNAIHIMRLREVQSKINYITFEYRYNNSDFSSKTSIINDIIQNKPELFNTIKKEDLKLFFKNMLIWKATIGEINDISQVSEQIEQLKKTYTNKFTETRYASEKDIIETTLSEIQEKYTSDLKLYLDAKSMLNPSSGVQNTKTILERNLGYRISPNDYMNRIEKLYDEWGIQKSNEKLEQIQQNIDEVDILRSQIEEVRELLIDNAGLLEQEKKRLQDEMRARRQDYREYHEGEEPPVGVFTNRIHDELQDALNIIEHSLNVMDKAERVKLIEALSKTGVHPRDALSMLAKAEKHESQNRKHLNTISEKIDRLEILQRDILAEQQKLDRSRREAETATKAAQQAQRDAALERERLQAELKTISDAKTKSEKLHQGLTPRIKRIRHEAESLDVEEERLQKEFERLEKERVLLRSEKENATQSNDAAAAQLSAREEELKRKEEEFRREITALTRNNESLASEIGILSTTSVQEKTRLENDKKRLMAGIPVMQLKIDNLETDLAKALEREKALNMKMTGYEEDAKRKSGALIAEADRSKSFESANSDLKQQLEELTRRLGISESDNERLRQKNNELSAEISQLKSNVENLSQTAAEAKQKYEEQLSLLTGQKGDLTADKSELAAEVDRLKKEAQAAEEKLSQAQGKLKAAEEQNKELSGALDAQRVAAAEAQARAEATLAGVQRELIVMTEGKASADKIANQLRAELERENKRLSELQKAMQSQIDALHISNKALTDEGKELTESLKDARKSLKEVDLKLQQAAAALVESEQLREALQSDVGRLTEAASDAKQKYEEQLRLLTEEKGDLTADKSKLATTVEQLRKEAQAAAQRLVEKQDKLKVAEAQNKELSGALDAQRQAAAEAQAKAQTTLAEVQRALSVMTEGKASADEIANQLRAELERENKRLLELQMAMQLQIDALHTSNKALTDEGKELAESLQAAKAAVKDADLKLQQKAAALVKSEQLREALQSDISKLTEAASGAKQKYEEQLRLLTEEKGDLTADKSKLAATVEQLRKEAQAAAQRLLEEQDKLKAAEEQNKELSGALDAQRQAAAEAQAKAQTTLADVQRKLSVMTEGKASADEIANQLRAELERENKRLLELQMAMQSQIEELRTSNKALTDEGKELAESLQAAKAAVKDADLKLHQKAAALVKSEQLREALQTDISKLTEAASGAKQKYEEQLRLLTEEKGDLTADKSKLTATVELLRKEAQAAAQRLLEEQDKLKAAEAQNKELSGALDAQRQAAAEAQARAQTTLAEVQRALSVMTEGKASADKIANQLRAELERENKLLLELQMAMQSQIDALHTSNKALTDEGKKLAESLQAAKAAVEDVGLKLQQKAAALVESEQLREALQSDVGKLTVAASEAKQRYEDQLRLLTVEKAGLTAGKSELAATVEQLRKEAQDAAQRLLEEQEKLKVAEAQNSELSAALDAERKASKAAQAKADAALADLQNQLNEMTQAKNKSNELATSLQARLRELESSLTQQTELAKSKSSSADQSAAEAAALQKQLKTLQSENDQLRRDLLEAQSKIEPIKSELAAAQQRLSDLDAQLGVALAAAAKAKQDADNARQQSGNDDKLKLEAIAREEKAEALKALAEAELKKLQESEAKLRSELEKAKHAEKIAIQRYDNLHQEYVMQGGTIRGLTDKFDSVTRENDKAKQEISGLHGQIHGLQSELSEARNALIAEQKAAELLQTKMDEFTRLLATAKQSELAALQKAERTEGELAIIKVELNTAKQGSLELTNQLHQISELLKQAKIKEAATQVLVESLRSQIQSLQGQLTSKSDSLTAKEALLASAIAELSQAKKQIAGLQDERLSHIAEIEKLTAALNAKKALSPEEEKALEEAKALKEQHKDSQAALIEMKKALEASQNELARVKDEVAQLKARNASIAVENATLREDMSTLQGQNTVLDQTNKQFKTENAALLAQNTVLMSENEKLKARLLEMERQFAALNAQQAEAKRQQELQREAQKETIATPRKAEEDRQPISRAEDVQPADKPHVDKPRASPRMIVSAVGPGQQNRFPKATVTGSLTSAFDYYKERARKVGEKELKKQQVPELLTSEGFKNLCNKINDSVQKKNHILNKTEDELKVEFEKFNVERISKGKTAKSDFEKWKKDREAKRIVFESAAVELKSPDRYEVQINTGAQDAPPTLQTAAYIKQLPQSQEIELGITLPIPETNDLNAENHYKQTLIIMLENAREIARRTGNRRIDFDQCEGCPEKAHLIEEYAMLMGLEPKFDKVSQDALNAYRQRENLVAPTRPAGLARPIEPESEIASAKPDEPPTRPTTSDNVLTFRKAPKT